MKAALLAVALAAATPPIIGSPISFDGDAVGQSPPEFVGEKVTVEQVPDPVKQVIAQQSQGGTVSEIKKKAKGGKTLYYASIAGGNAERRLTIDQDRKGISAESGSDEDDDD